MTESSFLFKSSKQNKELFNRGFAGSLALRVFSITVIFLVIPLLIYALVMYRYDFIVKKSSEGEKLRITADNEVLIFTELVDFALQRLQLLSIFIEDEKKIKNSEQINQFLKDITGFTGISGFFVLNKLGQDQVGVTYSSGLALPASTLNRLMFSGKLDNNNYGIFSDFEQMGQKGKIYFSKVLQRDAEDEALQTINLALSNKFFMEYLTKTKGFEGAINISLLNPQTGKIFDSQNLFLLGKKIVFKASENSDDEIRFNSFENQDDIYEYEEEGVKGLATIISFSQLDFQVVVSTPLSKESTYVQKFFYQTIFFLVSVLLIGSLGSFGLTYLLSTPLRKLRDVMKKISDDDLTVRYEKSPYGFEINTLGLMLNAMIDQLIKNLSTLEKEKIKKEKLQQELFIGQQIQKSLIPHHLPYIGGMEIQAVLIPAKQVGGDFYDLFLHPTKSDELILMIADSAGHGVFGCFYSLMMRSILRSLGSTMEDFSSFISASNAQLYQDSRETDVFVTAWIGSYNIKTKKLTFSSCGHPFGFLFRENKLFKELKTPGIALGVLEHMTPTVDVVEVLPGDTLIFLTDGVLETRSPEGELFGKKRFVDLIESHCSLSTEVLLEKLIEGIEIFEKSSDNQDDDVTAVIMRIKA